jgi:hypothetical protein
MVFRKFTRGFEKIDNLEDCDCAAKTSAREIADSQPGVWNVWFYKPRCQTEAVEDESSDERPQLRIFPEFDFTEDVLSSVQYNASVTRF